jgi:hypothetical protein
LLINPHKAFLFWKALFISVSMLKRPSPHRHALEMVTLEELVPVDHWLRKIGGAIDFTFIRDRVAHLYCPDNGRSALDPAVLFEVLFIIPV